MNYDPCLQLLGFSNGRSQSSYAIAMCSLFYTFSCHLCKREMEQLCLPCIGACKKSLALLLAYQLKAFFGISLRHVALQMPLQLVLGIGNHLVYQTVKYVAHKAMMIKGKLVSLAMFKSLCWLSLSCIFDVSHATLYYIVIHHQQCELLSYAPWSICWVYALNIKSDAICSNFKR